jgi:hypothetical protein
MSSARERSRGRAEGAEIHEPEANREEDRAETSHITTSGARSRRSVVPEGEIEHEDRRIGATTHSAKRPSSAA